MSTTTVFVCTLNGGKPKWSRYTYPFAIEAFTQLGDDLYIRHGDFVNKVSEDAVADEVDSVEVNFEGLVQWPHLDMGQPGVNKMLEGLDVVSEGTPSVSVGFDQRNLSAFTTPYVIPADTLPGGVIPLPVTAPSLAVKLTFAGGERWSVNAVNLYVQDGPIGR